MPELAQQVPVAPPPELIEGMCRTTRHDYGLVVREGERGMGSGMTEREREALRSDMRQLWHHDVRPYVERAVAEALAAAGVAKA